MSSSGVSTGTAVVAPASWHTLDFISDLHLHESEQETFLAWQHYMQQTPAQAVFILGDLFEAWVGDDVVGTVTLEASGHDSFELRCARILKSCAQQRDLFFMRGNRDFLVGKSFTLACGLRLLEDPSVLSFAGQRWLLTHGDALCLSDTEYMQFRAQVRGPAWQQQFLAQPLEQRKAIARGLRERSEARKKVQSVLYDVYTQAALEWVAIASADWLIHGHTHQPANHALGAHAQRVVLSDWDLRANPPRAQVLRITSATQTGPATVQRQAIASA